MHPEIGGDLLDRHTLFAVASDPHNVVAELLGIGPCHGDILPARPPWASDLRCHLSVQQTRMLMRNSAMKANTTVSLTALPTAVGPPPKCSPLSQALRRAGRPNSTAVTRETTTGGSPVSSVIPAAKAPAVTCWTNTTKK